MALLRQVKPLNKETQLNAVKKRENVQRLFWNQVGAVEHISLPKLEDTIKKEFKTKDDRFIQNQIKLMHTEARIKVQSKVKVWIKQPDKVQ